MLFFCNVKNLLTRVGRFFIYYDCTMQREIIVVIIKSVIVSASLLCSNRKLFFYILC